MERRDTGLVPVGPMAGEVRDEMVPEGVPGRLGLLDEMGVVKDTLRFLWPSMGELEG